VIVQGLVEDLHVHAKVVVSGTGVLRTYRDLVLPLAPVLPAAARRANAAISSLEATTELSCAFIFLFIGLDVPEEVGACETRSHNTWMYPTADYTRMEEEMETAQPWGMPMPMFVASGSAKDSGWAAKHGGRKKTIMVISRCPWHWVKPWASMSREARTKDAGYAAFKAKTKDVLMEDGFRKIFPELEQYIRHTSVGTPLSTNDFLGTDQGECYGRSATPTRWLCPALTPYTPVKNLYMTGQDVVTLGLTGAIAAGYLTANLLTGYGGLENLVLQRQLCEDLGVKPTF